MPVSTRWRNNTSVEKNKKERDEENTLHLNDALIVFKNK